MAKKRLIYAPVPELSRHEIELALARNDPSELHQAVLAAALYSPDCGWAEQICLQLSSHEDTTVRGNAILGFGHIARIHGTLSESKVRPLLQAALLDPSDYVRGHAVDAIDDATLYLKWRFE